MSDNFQIDPRLQSFEKQLAIQVPLISGRDRDQILYTSAFAAGRKNAARSLRSWQATTGILVALLVLAVIPHWNAPQRNEIPLAAKPTKSEPSSPASELRQEKKSVISPERVANLDAWQRTRVDELSVGDQFAQLDPMQRACTVMSLSRTLGQP